jgi:fumarate reductase subunit D
MKKVVNVENNESVGKRRIWVLQTVTFGCDLHRLDHSFQQDFHLAIITPRINLVPYDLAAAQSAPTGFSNLYAIRGLPFSQYG